MRTHSEAAAPTPAAGAASVEVPPAVAADLDPRGRPKSRTYTLSSGQVVVQRRGDGNVLTTAERLSAGRGQFAFSVAYLALVCTFDGSKIVFEALLEWDAEDLIELVEAAGLSFFGGSPRSAS